MAKRYLPFDTTTLTQMRLDDGTVHYRVDYLVKYLVKPTSERVLEWTVTSLWVLVGAVLVTTAFSL